MKLSHNWLQHYIKFKLTPEELSEKLTMLGLEVEGIEYLGEKYSGFVVGKVTDVQKHPNADKLSVCTVAIGKKHLQIVCGAPNVAAGQKVAVGLSGAVVPKNQHDPNGKPFTLSNVTLRGVESFGMICSEYELDLGPDKDGILVLNSKARIGQSLSSYLGLDDIVYEIGITPNRPDLLSHFGVAREIGILVGRTPSLPKVKLKESKTSIKQHFSVRVDDSINCPRFAVRMIRGVKIQPSPEWLQNALRAVGLRPRNNVVDVTNYVMLECGQPMHAFDYALLKGKKIVVRQAGSKAGSGFRVQEKFITLDGKEHELPSDAVMVCDGERSVSIAGIMGGENSEISDSTTDVVLESAYWNPASIRRTAKALGIHSDASYRFERGADPNASDYALDRAAQLIVQTAGGELLKGRIDVYPKRINEKILSLRTSWCNHVLGTSLSTKEVREALKKLGITQHAQPAIPSLKRRRGVARKHSKDILTFKVPTYRVDIEREIDLIEEVARVFGYNNIESKTVAPIDFDHPFGKDVLADRIRQQLVGFGYQECLTISIQDEGTVQLSAKKPVVLKNPLGKEMSTMRSSLIPGLLQTAALNQNYRNTDLRLFEIGHVFEHRDAPQLVGTVHEEARVCLLLSGQHQPRHWKAAAQAVNLFDLKGEVADLLDACGLDSWRYIYYSTSETLADNPIFVEINGTRAGFLGKVKDEICRRFEFAHETFIAELKLSLLDSQKAKKYKPLPKFPKALRDVAFVLDATIAADRVENCIRESGAVFLNDVEVFDVYEGENLPPEKKSLAFTLVFMSHEKTLTDAEIDAEVQRVVEQVIREFHAELRR